MLSDNNKQKSPQRRFFLILAAVLFAAILAWGLMVIFDDKMFPGASRTQKILFGVVIIAYAFIRIPRIVKKKDNEI